MYEARKICNYLLAHYDAREFNLTNLRLNKLIFFIHAAGLAERPDGLVRNHFEAWQFGPVIRPVFDAFKSYGDRWISAPARYLDYSTGQERPIPFDDIAPADAEIIDRVFKQYSHFTTGQLVALSHEPGGPWDVIFKAQLADKSASPRIPNELIRRHLVGELKSASRH
ncbi:Panacea domain-containing protein [Tardiphaga sp. 604_B6_N1_1]|uniref:Panacea domain-containing protein n=1 Tax=Tardiphaga sp. 604_B6_N1_1 TaxID=3240779 RepID=UPI003F25DD98